MADRFATVFEEAHSVCSIDRLIESFQPFGLTITCPHDGAAYALSPVGEQIKLRPEELRQQILSSTNSSFQWWFSDAQWLDVYCRIRQLSSAVIIDFGLDGKNPIEELHLVVAILRHFERDVREGCAKGVVVDRWGATEDYDWSRFFIEEEFFPGPMPDFLGLPRQALNRLPDPSTYYSYRHELGDFVLLKCLAKYG